MAKKIEAVNLYYVTERLIVRELNHFCRKFFDQFVSVQTYRNFIAYNTSFFSGLSGKQKGCKALSKFSKSSYESLQNFIGDAQWDATELNNARIYMLQQDEFFAMKSNGCISIDDVEQLHYGKTSEFVDYQYSSTVGKPIKSVKFVNQHYHDDRVDYQLILKPYEINKNVTVSMQILNCTTHQEFAAKISSNRVVQDAIISHMTLYKAKKISLIRLTSILELLDLKPKEQHKIESRFKRLSHDFKSKIDIACDGINSTAKQYGIADKIFLFDAWYATSKIINLVISHKAHYVARSKENRIFVTESGDEISAAGLVTSNAESFVSINETTSGFFKQVQLKEVGAVTIVVLKDRKNGVRIFITDLSPSEGGELQFLAMIADYVRKHWIIEEGHKKLNFLGLDNYCGHCSEKGLEKHAAMVLFRYTFLVYLSGKKKWRTFVKNVKAAGKSVLNSIYDAVNALILEEQCKLKVAKVLEECRLLGLEV